MEKRRNRKFWKKWQVFIRMMENRKASFEEISQLKNEKEQIFKRVSKINE